MVRISPQIRHIKESATLAINQKVHDLRAAGKSVVHLGFGESPFAVPELIVHTLKEHAHEKKYLPGAGLPELREACSQFHLDTYQYHYGADDVFISPGSKEMIMHLLFLLHGPVLLPQPTWVTYQPQATLVNKITVPINTHIENHYCLQALELENACLQLDRKQQKILILTNPNNPTGAVHSQENFNALAEVCRKNNIIVIADEIYNGIEFYNKQHTSMSYAYPEGTIVTGGLSKYFAAGGYRLGFALIPKEMQLLKQALITLISETFSSVSAPIQYAATCAYRDYQAIKSYLDQGVSLHKLAADYCYSACKDMQLACAKPQGAFYLFPNFNHYKEPLKKQGIHNIHDLTTKLLNNHHVALLPGSDFGMPESDFSVRMTTVDYNGPEAIAALCDSPLDTSLVEKVMPNLVTGMRSIKNFLAKL